MENIKVLVVDDEAKMRKLVKDFLSIKGFTVVEAGDGEEALEIFYKEKDIKLILLDVMMPRMDGWETLRAIREQSDLPIIMLTARSRKEMSCWALIWEWTSISPSPSAPRYWWRGWKPYLEEAAQIRRKSFLREA